MKQHYILKDLPAMKHTILATISSQYWELSEKKDYGYNLQVEQKEHKSFFSFWQPPMPEIPYRLGKKFSSMTGEKGKRKLVEFLAELTACTSAQQALSLLQTTLRRVESEGSVGFSMALSRAIMQCVRQVDANQSNVTDEQSIQNQQILQGEQQILKGKERDYERIYSL